MTNRIGTATPAIRRLRRWLSLKHKVKSGTYVRFPDTRLRDEYGLTRLVAEDQGPSACEGMISSEIRVREIRTSGLMSGDWKRGHGSRTEARRENAGQATGP